MDKYAKEFARALTASGVSSSEIAQSIGVDPSYISQCKTGRRPIPADKARVIAEMIHADPAAISKSYEELLQILGPVPASYSHPVRLDPVILSQAYKALLTLDTEADHPISLANLDDAAHFVQVYEMRAAMPVQPSQEELIEFGRKLAMLTPTGGDDGRGGGAMPAEGAHKSKVAGKVRRKA